MSCSVMFKVLHKTVILSFQTHVLYRGKGVQSVQIRLANKYFALADAKHVPVNKLP